MTERVGREGDVYSKIGQMIRDTGYSKPVNIELATVIESPPNLRIKLDQDGLVLEKEDLIVAERLTRHKRIVTIEHNENVDRDLGDVKERDYTDTDDRMGPNKGDPSPPYSDTYFRYNYVEMQFEDLLKPGERVLVACLDEDMVYVVLDRAVWYE